MGEQTQIDDYAVDMAVTAIEMNDSKLIQEATSTLTLAEIIEMNKRWAARKAVREERQRMTKVYAKYADIQRKILKGEDPVPLLEDAFDDIRILFAGNLKILIDALHQTKKHGSEALVLLSEGMLLANELEAARSTRSSVCDSNSPKDPTGTESPNPSG